MIIPSEPYSFEPRSLLLPRGARHNGGVFRERTSGDDITPQVRRCRRARRRTYNNCHLFFLDISCIWPVLRLCNRKTGRYTGMLVIAAFRDRSIRIERLLCDDRKAGTQPSQFTETTGSVIPNPLRNAPKCLSVSPARASVRGMALLKAGSIHWRILSAAYAHIPSSSLSWKTVTSIRQSDHWPPMRASACISHVTLGVVGQILTAEGFRQWRLPSGRTQSNASSCWHSPGSHADHVIQFLIFVPRRQRTHR